MVKGIPSIQRPPSGFTRSGWFAYPVLILASMIILWPLGRALVTSFYREPILGSRTNVGLDNYTALLTSPAWWASVGVTIAITGTIVALQVSAGLFIATVMRYAPAVRAPLAYIVLVPFAALPYAWTHTWFSALDGGYLATWLNISSLDTSTTVAAIIIAESWRGVGIAALICYVGLTRVPQRLMESARADGARLRQRWFRVAVPGLAPVLAIVIVFRLVDTVRLFDPAVVARDYPGAESPDLFALALFRTFAERGELGLASAAAILLIVSLALLTALITALIAALAVGVRRWRKAAA